VRSSRSLPGNADDDFSSSVSAFEIADRLRRLAQRSLAQLLSPFVVTLDVYTSDQKPEEKWKFPNNRTYANNPAKCLVVVGIKNISIGIC